MFRNILIACFLLINVAAFAAAGYSGAIDDLPLMPGMVERADEAVVFDKPGGRIIETSAEIASSITEVQKFYQETLPPLGWKTGQDLSFTREGEELKLALEQKEGKTLVHFTLTPGR